MVKELLRPTAAVVKERFHTFPIERFHTFPILKKLNIIRTYIDKERCYMFPILKRVNIL